MLHTFLYADERVGLDKYDIVERGGVRTIHNWLQYFDIDSLVEELASAGLTVEHLHGDLTGAPLGDDPLDFAVVASPLRSAPVGRSVDPQCPDIHQRWVRP